jgi:hypothetical protein
VKKSTKGLQVRIGLTKKQYRKGLGPARKPSPRILIDNKSQNGGLLYDYSNESVSNNICLICGGDHDVLVISLENGGHIVTKPFSKDKGSTVKAGSCIKARATKLDLVDILWPTDGDEYLP